MNFTYRQRLVWWRAAWRWLYTIGWRWERYALPKPTPRRFEGLRREAIHDRRWRRQRFYITFYKASPLERRKARVRHALQHAGMWRD